MDLSPYIPAEMKIRYVTRRKADLASLEEALRQHDGEAFKRVGHQIKGNAATYAYRDLETIGVELERAGASGDFEKAREALDAFRGWISVSDLL